MQARTRLLVIALSAGVACLAVSVALGATQRLGKTSAGDSTLSIAIDGDIDTLDPTFAQTAQARMVFANMCWKLYDINASLAIKPELAAAMPKVSSSGLQVTIPLRRGVRFNDGTAFNAQAVKTTLMRDLTAKGSARASDLGPVKSVAVVNPYTVRINLTQPYAPLASQLADRAGMIMSPAQLKKKGANFGTAPVCAGPFAYAGRVPGTSITLTKSKYFYGAKSVHLSKVVFRVVPDGTVRASLLRSGDVGAAISLAGPDLPAVKSDKNLVLRSEVGLATYHIRINIGNHGPNQPRTPYNTPLAQHPELREALDLAIDRKALNTVAYGGTVVPDCAPISTVNPYHVANPPCPASNVALAKQLVTKSGVQTPIAFTLMYLQGSDNQRAAQVIQAMVAKVGFNATLQPVDIPTAVQDEASGNYQVLYSYWSGRVDPDGDIYPFNSSHGSQDNTGATSAAIDKLLDQARETTAEATRMKLYKSALKLIEQRRNILYLFHPKNYTGVNKNVEGFAIFADNLPRAYGVRLGG